MFHVSLINVSDLNDHGRVHGWMLILKLNPLRILPAHGVRHGRDRGHRRDGRDRHVLHADDRVRDHLLGFHYMQLNRTLR